MTESAIKCDQSSRNLLAKMQQNVTKTRQIVTKAFACTNHGTNGTEKAATDTVVFATKCDYTTILH